MVDEEVGIEVALPIVPKLRCIRFERGHIDAGPLQRLRRLPVVVARGPIDELEHVLGNAKIGTALTIRLIGDSEPSP